jgi:hypothetical protein
MDMHHQLSVHRGLSAWRQVKDGRSPFVIETSLAFRHEPLIDV